MFLNNQSNTKNVLSFYFYKNLFDINKITVEKKNVFDFLKEEKKSFCWNPNKQKNYFLFSF